MCGCENVKNEDPDTCFIFIYECERPSIFVSSTNAHSFENVYISPLVCIHIYACDDLDREREGQVAVLTCAMCLCRSGVRRLRDLRCSRERRRQPSVMALSSNSSLARMSNESCSVFTPFCFWTWFRVRFWLFTLCSYSCLDISTIQTTGTKNGVKTDRKWCYLSSFMCWSFATLLYYLW